jgi:hypothetical protein
VILEAPRQQEVRHLERRFFGEEQKAVFAHRCVERRVQFLPVGEKLGKRARIHHCARQNVRADFRSFFDHADADLVSALRSKLFKAYRARKSGRPRAHYDYIVLHRFAFGHGEGPG